MNKNTSRKKIEEFKRILADSVVKSKTSPFIFLDSNSCDENQKQSFFFHSFIDYIIFKPGDSVSEFFNKINHYLEKKYWLAGYFNYEFAYVLDKSFSHFQENGEKLAWLGVTKKPEIITHKEKLKFDIPLKNFSITKNHFNVTKDEFSKNIKKIKYYLKSGKTYQVNYTFKERFSFHGDAASFYMNLRENQPTDYSAYIYDGKNNILSLSPELFFKRLKNKIFCRPMKGTSKRGVSFSEDKINKTNLLNSSKDKSENLMIVDLLRNDLGKLGTGVKVSDLFLIETYPSLFQMVSNINADMKNGISYKDIFQALYPCGSITGAPKIETMKIIQKLEKEPRNVYTGAMGYFSPENTACFNVPIRTIKINRNNGEIGIGGGIVYDSKPNEEYQEAILKSKFKDNYYDKKNFHLIETMLLKNSKYYLLNLHLNRLKQSASYFKINIDFKALKKELKIISSTTLKINYKIRILVNTDGIFKIIKTKLRPIKSEFKLALSKQKVNSKSVFIYFKTSNRDFYETKYKAANIKGYDEIIFLNEKGEITEGSFTNIFVKIKNILYTPKISSGVLPGTLREHLLANNKVKEKTLKLKDLENANDIFVGNSVRDLIKCTLDKNCYV